MLTFILSSGRTGTVFLHNVLSQLPGVSSMHERGNRFFRTIQNLSKQGISIKAFDWLLKKFYHTSLSNIGKNGLHFEINPAIKFHLNYFLEKFPEANYVHIVRDPRDHVRSGVNWVYGKPANKFFKLNFPYWSSKPSSYPYLGKKQQDKIFEISLQNWKDSQKALFRIKQMTSNYMLLKFEDLVHNPYQFFEDLLYFHNYSLDKDIANILLSNISSAPKNFSQKFFPAWDQWEDKYIRYLYRQCDSLMKELGYGHEANWQERVRNALEPCPD